MDEQPIRVLVADGDANSRRNTSWHLQDAGFCVIPAATGSDVLLQCELDAPDVIIIDDRLPDLDGYDVCGQLRHDPATSDIPIVVIAAAKDAMSRAYLAKMVDYAGGDFFLAKPYDLHVLMQLVVDLAPRRNVEEVRKGPAFPTRVTWPTKRSRYMPLLM